MPVRAFGASAFDLRGGFPMEATQTNYPSTLTVTLIRGLQVVDTPCPLHSRMCRLVTVSNVTVTHSYIAPASSAFTAHSGATLIKGNCRSAAPASVSAWPGRLTVSKYPSSVWRSVPALWLGWHRTLTPGFVVTGTCALDEGARGARN